MTRSIKAKDKRRMAWLVLVGAVLFPVGLYFNPAMRDAMGEYFGLTKVVVCVYLGC